MKISLLALILFSMVSIVHGQSTPAFNITLALYYRPVVVLGVNTRAYHTFWLSRLTEYSGSNPVSYDLIQDAGPTNPGTSCALFGNCGTLDAHLSEGDIGYLSADNIATSTQSAANTFGPSSNDSLAFSLQLLEFYTLTFPNGTITYKRLGPNSNTFSYQASVAAKLATTKPPVLVPGWGQNLQ